MKGKKIEYDFNALRRNVMMALCLTKLSGTDFRIIIFILNQTDAYHRAEDKIRPAFFLEKTGLTKGNVRRTIARLRNWKMITKQGQVYSVLSPDKWEKGVFPEQQNRFNIEALLELEPGPECFKSEAPSASNLKRPELKSEAVSVSHIENSSIENSIIEKKTAVSLEEYKQQLRERFSDLDFDLELEKFTHYWSEGTRKLKRPKLSLLNWMLKARKIKAQEGQGGAHRQSSRSFPKQGEYKSPEEIWPEDYGKPATTQELKDSIGRPLD